MRMLLVLLWIFVGGCALTPLNEEKMNGVSFVASRDKVLQQDIDPVLNIHANYVAIMPFGFLRSLEQPTVEYNNSNQWYGETLEGAKQYIEEMHRNKLKVMLKPQIWVWKGEFTGNIKMKTEADWKELEVTYKRFIMDYAQLAQDTQVAVYCIGTELELFIAHRPEYWKALVKSVKEVYKGKITYAANWDEFPKTPFWNQLDYIGIDGYFPLTEEKTPTEAALIKGWEKPKAQMKQYADSLQRKIVFTEFGYRSTDYAAAKPWEVDYNKTSVNLEGQSIATKVLLEELWKEDWFAGGFVWKWFTEYDKVGGPKNSRFTPQNKPAENVISTFYLRHKKK